MPTNWTSLPNNLNPAFRRLVEQLRAVKDASGLTLAELGAKTHYSRASWERWLNGKRLITRPALLSLSTALAIDTTSMLSLLDEATVSDDNRPETEVPSPVPVPVPVASSAIAHLPADTRVFTGRAPDLEQLLGLVSRVSPATVVISAIDGMAGVGKSALAIHAAHRLRAYFPDGQLFLDLHGHTAGLAPLTAEDALEALLRALDVPADRIPRGVEERAARYRDRLAGSRTLIVLDDAVAAAQIRPLLPGTPGCLVLVTSRKRLVSLDDAHSVTLDVLSNADAAVLLGKVAGPDRVRPDDPATAELLALCGHLPLAIRITAARLRHRSVLSVDDLVTRLRDENSRLEQFADEDRNVTAALESSFAALPDAERRLVGLLGLVPGPGFEAHAAANLAGTDVFAAERLLESLLDHHLLIQPTPGRYRFHDLVRLHARRAGASIPRAEREAALVRLWAYYRVTAARADQHLARYTRPGDVPEAGTAVETPELRDLASALAWLRAEKAGLLAALSAVPEGVAAADVIALTSALAAFLLLDGPWPQAAELHEAAAGLALDAGDRLAGANALWEAGRARQMTGDYAASGARHDRALTVYREIGNPQGEANALGALARARLMTGEVRAAIDLLESALTLCRSLADRRGEAGALWDLSRARRVTGDIPAAAGLSEAALELFRTLGDRQGEANAVFEAGRVQECLGYLGRAQERYRAALEIFQELDSRSGISAALQELGRLHYATGDYAAALAFHERALEIGQSAGTAVGRANCLTELGRVHLAMANFPRADDLLREALTAYRNLGHRVGESTVRHELGRLHLAAGDHPAADRELRQARAIAQEVQNPFGEAEIVTSLGALAAVDATYGEPLELYGRAIDLAQQTHNSMAEARARHGRARCLAHQGDRAAALADLREAVALYQGTGAAEAAAADLLLAELEAAG